MKIKKPPAKIAKTAKQLEKAKLKSQKAGVMQPFSREPPSEFISYDNFVQPKQYPDILQKYTVKTLIESVNEYFRDVANQPYQLASFQFHLGFYDNAKWDNLLDSEDLPGDLTPFRQIIIKAVKYIEAELVHLLLSRSQVVGILFYLKSKFKYIEKFELESISAQAIDIRFTVETEQEKIIRGLREEEEQKHLLLPGSHK